MSYPPNLSQQTQVPSTYPPHSSQPTQEQEAQEPQTELHDEDETDDGDNNGTVGKGTRKKSIAKKNQTRGKAPRVTKTDRTYWTQEEEKLLVECFIQISEDPKYGSDQKFDTFWYKIMAEYNRSAVKKGLKTRNKNMLTGKWTPMNGLIGKFNALYDQTTLASGENEELMYGRVCQMFKEQHLTEFKHREAWVFLRDKYKWQNPESTQARRTRGRVIDVDEEPEMFGQDAIPRPSGAPRKSKSQRSSTSSSATSCSSKARVAELMEEQILIDREKKKETMDRELAARLAVCDIAKRNEDLQILSFDTSGMNPEGAEGIEELKRKTRALYFGK